MAYPDSSRILGQCVLEPAGGFVVSASAKMSGSDADAAEWRSTDVR
jgi:hypothetical protein